MVIASLALAIMVGGWTLWTLLTAGPLFLVLDWTAIMTPVDTGPFNEFGSGTDVSTQVCAAASPEKLDRLSKAVLLPDGQGIWTFRHRSWLLCIDATGNRDVNISFDPTGQCTASVKLRPACEL